MTTIYLSSTYEDLKEYRRVVFDTLLASDYQVKAMEYYVATDQRPVDKCLKDVANADIYVGIYAFRYGYIPPPEHNNPKGLSITELEFREAETLKKPCLTFVATEEAVGTIPFKLADVYTGDGEKGEKIKQFRQYLGTERIKGQFSQPHELANKVLLAVKGYLEENKKTQSSNGQKTEAAPAITWDIAKDGSPYPGLMHFNREKYAPVFFGRDAEIVEVLDRLRLPEGRFLIVSGGSGTGKSSLVDAGVLQRIEKSGLGEGKRFVCVRMVPSQGDHPFDALTRILHLQREQVGFTAYGLGKELRAQPTIFLERIQTIIAKGINNQGLVLFLDQMEELFTPKMKDDATPFLSALYNAANETGFRVIATIRSDFLHHCHNHPEMLKVLNGKNGHYCLGRVEPFMMRDMIVKPAERAGLIVPDRLVSRLVQETGTEPGNLPLLAFVLRRLFEKQSDGVLTEEAYDSLGGIAGAIGDYVHTVEKEMIEKGGGSGALDLLPRIFALLVVNEAGRPTRRRFPLAEIPENLRSIVDVLIEARLLSSERLGGTDTVSVAHEKLFEAWPALAKWIDENQSDLFLLWRAQIEAREWQKHGFDLVYLWPVDRLKQLQAILERLSDPRKDPLVSYASPQEGLRQRLEEISLTHQDRLKIGNYLAELGDRRPGVGLTDEGIPHIDWVEIPEGKVELAHGKGTFLVKSFRISRYPVTNIQFEAFVKDKDGYSSNSWWDRIERRRTPFSPQWKEVNRPRDTVTWYEAVAFCRWLTQKYRDKGLLNDDQEIQLPTEWEWQQAATGGDNERDYPWKGPWDPTRCNSNESGLSSTTAVGVYPAGATLHGVQDMAGNVLEWCLNKYDELRDLSRARREPRAQRGGSWIYGSGRLQASFRVGDYPGAGTVGFRVAQKNRITWDGDESSSDFETVSIQRDDSSLEEMAAASESERTISNPGRIFYDILKDGSNGPEMVVIVPQTFRMGDVKGDGRGNELPVHMVRIQKAFAIGRYLVTFEQYDKFATRMNLQRYAPDDGQWHDRLRVIAASGQRPVVNVSWHDAVEFAKWLSLETGKAYRLPSEAEWEFAARSGGKQEVWAGTSSETELNDYAWYADNSQGRTHTVGSKRPNRLGLYDMSGNVWEWVQDCWHNSYDGAPTDGSAWGQENDGDCSRRVIRGGSWYSVPGDLLVSGRGKAEVSDRTNIIGFRLAQDID